MQLASNNIFEIFVFAYMYLGRHDSFCLLFQQQKKYVTLLQHLSPE